jgi:hypothetical protein
MKKTIIGGILVLTGTLISLCMITAAALVFPSITSWSGSNKFWFIIFGAKQYGNEVSHSLFLGFPFVVGIILFLIGLIVLGIEYCKKDN